MILLMGIAGSGKGTQGKLLADSRGYHLISMGDVLRMYATSAQRERMHAGELLDDQEIISLIDQVLKTIADDQECILDGFPRTIPQAEWLLSQVEAGRYSNMPVAVHLVASREAVKQRLLGRGRADDQDAAIEARFDEYERSTAPLVDWLVSHGVQLYNINAERSVADVNQDIVSHL